jgi:hypothetical protein
LVYFVPVPWNLGVWRTIAYRDSIPFVVV